MSPRSLAAQLADTLADGGWRAKARPEQLAPPGDWLIWLLCAGRGFGKTRSGAEWVQELVESGDAHAIALIAPTAADARDVMCEGPAGFLAIASPRCRPSYEPSKRRLTWPNGATATLFSSEEADRLRGPQFDAAWCDELAAWNEPQHVWDMLQFGLRLGIRPRTLVTTTPRPIPLLKRIINDPGTVVTRGSTFDNAANLSPSFLTAIRSRYEGTRLGRQELQAELLEDVPGALWQRERIERNRISAAALPQLSRVVVAIDPAVTSGEDADETGIVCAGIGVDGQGYVLDDRSGSFTPDAWAREAVAIYRARRADRIVAEVNNGGDMVEATIRTVDPNVPYKAVHASRGKAVRAEPVAALYEQGRVHHVGSFPVLEDQLCAFTSDFERSSSPDRLDALVWALTELMVSESNTGIIEYYRRRVEQMRSGAQSAPHDQKKPSEFLFAFGPKPDAPANTVLRAPAGVSTVFGKSGTRYLVGEERFVIVNADDAPALKTAGFQDASAAEMNQDG